MRLAGVCLAGLVAAVLATGLSAQERVNFERDVLPLLTERCFKCHSTEYKGKARKPKSGLLMSAKAGILAGGKGGRILEAGNPERSQIYARAALPDDHEDVMPPDGEVFEKSQLAIIRRWIAEGADFGTWTGKGELAKDAAAPAAAANARPPKRFEVYARLAEKLSPASGQAIKTAQAAGARVEPVMPGSPLLRVEFLASPQNTTDKEMKGLAALNRHIAILSLGGSKVTDRALAAIAKMPQLVRLDLNRTGVTDRGLKTLAKSKPKELRSLNLYGTAVTDAGIGALALPQLTAIYLWGTKTTDAGIAKFRERHPDCRVHHKRNLPAAEGARQDGNNRRRRR